MQSKWFSRKFIAAVVAFIFSVVGTAGYNMPVDEVAMVDGVLMLYILVEGIIDSIKVKNGK